MVLRFLTRAPARDPAPTAERQPALTQPAPARPAETEPVVLAPDHEVEQPTAPSVGRRALVLAAVGGVGLGAVTWFGVIPAVAGAGDAPAEALPASSMVVQARPDPAVEVAAEVTAAVAAVAPAEGTSAPVDVAPARAGHGDAPAVPAPERTPRDPFAPLESTAGRQEERPEPVTVVADPDVAPAPTGVGATPVPAAPTGPPVPPAPAVRGPGVEFSGEPVTIRLLTATSGVAEQPGEVRVSLDGLVLRLRAGESFAALTLLAVGDPCGALQLAGQPFVLCEGQERTLRFGG